MGAPGKPTVHAPLSAGVLGAQPDEELSHFHLHDPEALRAAIRSCVGQIGRSVRHAHLALDGLLIRTMSLPIPFTPPREELELAVRSEAERYRIFAGSEVACDFEILDSAESGLTVLVAAGQRPELDGIVEVFEGEGVTIDSIEPAPLAVFRGLAGEAELQDCGIVAAFPTHLHVVLREGGALHSWRALYVSAETLRAGDPSALAETRRELQRSLHDLGGGTCFLVDVPDPLMASLTETEGGAFQTLEHSSEVGGLAMRGALRFRQEPGPFAFDLRRDRSKPPPKPVSRGVGIPLAFAGVLILALVANLWLSERVKAREGATDALQAEMSAAQAQLARPDHDGAAREALRAALDRSESAATLFRLFQDETPHDAWISRTELTAQSTLLVEGYALSRQAPLILAEALRRSPTLADLVVPAVAEAELQGQKVYRFRIEAAFKPQGVPRP
jgi:hypothetical protein